jgi:N-acetylmuramoyl-L-alanine amidase
MAAWKPRIDVDISADQKGASHGRGEKDQIILHETVSRNAPGTGDIRNTSYFLGNARHDGVRYGIHGITDGEGHKAWANRYGTAIFYHCSSSGSKGQGTANTRGIGIEQISDAPLLATRALRIAWWDNHKKLQTATAELIAWQSHLKGFPLDYSDGTAPGITTHWSVSQAYGVPGGHWDCFPRHLGGHFPAFDVILEARAIAKKHYGT